jgi:hypothetical protein
LNNYTAGMICLVIGAGFPLLFLIMLFLENLSRFLTNLLNSSPIDVIAEDQTKSIFSALLFFVGFPLIMLYIIG